MRNKFAWIFGAAALLLALVSITALHAAKGSAVPHGGLALTIYNQQFAVVRQPIELNLQEGINNVRYSETTAHLEPDSVILRDPTGQHEVQILEQNYRNDPVTEARLLSAYEGKEIEFEVNRDGKPQIIKAKLIRSGYVPHYNAFQRYGSQYQFQQMAMANGDGGGEGSPIVELDGQIQFGLPGRPIFPSLLSGSLMKPTLDWLLHSDSEGKVNAELSYVTGGMTWAADYNAVAPENGNKLDITGWVTMDNQSGKTFDEAKIKLMAGEVSKMQPNELYASARAMSQMDAIGGVTGQVQEKAFDEYHLYTLPRPVTLHDRETKQVEFIRAADVKADRVYVYDGAKIGQQYQYWGYEQIRQNREYGTEMNTDIWVMQEIKNSKSNNLGMPLPKGRVRFYRRDTDGALEFIGENEIKHTPTDETLRIFTGDAFDLVGERRQTNFQTDYNGHKIDETFEIKLRNHKKEPVEIRTVEHLYRCVNWEISQKSDDFIKTDSRTAEFRVRVPAGGEKTLNYTVHYTW